MNKYDLITNQTQNTPKVRKVRNILFDIYDEENTILIENERLKNLNIMPDKTPINCYDVFASESITL